MLCRACQRRLTEKVRYFLIFRFFGPVFGGLSGGEQADLSGKEGGDRPVFAFFFHKIIFLCTTVPGWLEKCWLSAQSSGLEGAGRTHRCEGGPAGEKQGEDRLRQGAQEDAGSDTPVRGGRAGRMRVSPGRGGKPCGTLAGMGCPVAVPLPQPPCRGWARGKAALGPV